MNDDSYPFGLLYRFGPFTTIHNEYTRDAHSDLRKQAQKAGWTCVRMKVAELHRPKKKNILQWFDENQIAPLSLSYYNELWFENKEDAALFKLTWL